MAKSRKRNGSSSYSQGEGSMPKSVAASTSATPEDTDQENVSRFRKPLLVWVSCGCILATMISIHYLWIGDKIDNKSGGSAAQRVSNTQVETTELTRVLNENNSETMRTLEQIQIAATGTAPCHLVTTHHVHVFGLPSPVKGTGPIQMTAGPIHKLTIISYDIDGKSRCAGGDYFEADLSSDYWKSRPYVMDLADGSYLVTVQVDPQFAGRFMFRIRLAFTNFKGMQWVRAYSPIPSYRGEDVFRTEIEFVAPETSSEHAAKDGELHRCNAGKGDFSFQRWSGRWTRREFNNSCKIEADGRFKCLNLDTPCEQPWCEGPVGRLESNGWVYSTHCSFRIFTEDEAWDCLDRKWIFWWGDSNHQDSIRNLLSFVLGFPYFQSWIPRRFDQTYIRTANPKQSVRITMFFNGHAVEDREEDGLASFSDRTYRALIESYFSNKQVVPDAMIMNSGLHDGPHWSNVKQYMDIGVSMAMEFWNNLLPRMPLVIFRHTVTTAAHIQKSTSNPSKLELYSRILGESFERLDTPNLRIVDNFDMTFPWHYTTLCTDGVHYGRQPSNTNLQGWQDGRIGHEYFVDLMLVHVHLNIICPIK